MTFLQILSKNAYQNITYHCRNSVAYIDKRTRKFDKSAIFKTYNDLELVSQKPAKFKYAVSKDECQVNNNSISSLELSCDVSCNESSGESCDESYEFVMSCVMNL